VFVVVTLAERADKFDMFEVLMDTDTALSVAIFEIVWYDWKVLSVAIFAFKAPNLDTFPVCVLEMTRLAVAHIRFVMFENATFS
jgi:hypothetical protein